MTTANYLYFCFIWLGWVHSISSKCHGKHWVDHCRTGQYIPRTCTHGQGAGGTDWKVWCMITLTLYFKPPRPPSNWSLLRLVSVLTTILNKNPKNSRTSNNGHPSTTTTSLQQPLFFSRQTAHKLYMYIDSCLNLSTTATATKANPQLPK